MRGIQLCIVTLTLTSALSADSRSLRCRTRDCSQLSAAPIRDMDGNGYTGYADPAPYDACVPDSGVEACDPGGDYVPDAQALITGGNLGGCANSKHSNPLIISLSCLFLALAKRRKT